MENKNLVKCKACGADIARGVKKCPHCGKDQRNFFGRHKIITSLGIIIVLIIIITAVSSGGNDTTPASSISNSNKQENRDSTSVKSNNEAETKSVVKQRQIAGKATDLGAGTFTVGKDIEEGLYDVTPVEGSGNFIIQNENQSDLSVNEILGTENGAGGISKARVKLVKDEQIQLDGINKTHFEPVNSSFITTQKSLSIYSGRWIVGEDVGSGRYVATPASGAGNFIVYDKMGLPKVNEILGEGGVKQVTIDLNDGDIITAMGLNQVDLAPNK